MSSSSISAASSNVIVIRIWCPNGWKTITFLPWSASFFITVILTPPLMIWGNSRLGYYQLIMAFICVLNRTVKSYVGMFAILEQCFIACCAQWIQTREFILTLTGNLYWVPVIVLGVKFLRYLCLVCSLPLNRKIGPHADMGWACKQNLIILWRQNSVVTWVWILSSKRPDTLRAWRDLHQKYAKCSRMATTLDLRMGNDTNVASKVKLWKSVTSFLSKTIWSQNKILIGCVRSG